MAAIAYNLKKLLRYQKDRWSGMAMKQGLRQVYQGFLDEMEYVHSTIRDFFQVIKNTGKFLICCL